MSAIKKTLSTCLQHLIHDLKPRQYGESICLMHLPQHLQCHIKVVGFQDNAVTIATSGACWLHALRHHEHTLIRALVQAGYTHIKKVNWRINPKITSPMQTMPTKNKTKRTVSPNTIDVVAQAAQGCTGQQTKAQLQCLLNTLRKVSK